MSKPKPVTRIDALTDDQIAAMPAWRDRWIRIGLCTRPAPRAKVEKALRTCYRYAGLDGSALKVVWVRSPQEAATAVDSVVHSVVYSTVRSAVQAAVRSAVDSAIHSAVRSAVYSVVYSTVRSAVVDSADSAVYSAVSAAYSVVYSAYFGGQAWAGEPAYVSFLRERCGLRLPNNLAARARAYATIHNNGPILMFKPLAICFDRPAAIRLRAGRLHAESCPALEWRDGAGIFAWRGTVVPEDWILRPNQMDPTIALTHTNVELRRCAAEIIGWGKVLAHLPHRTIQADPDPQIGTLIEVDLPGSPASRFLKVRCPTARDFVIPVPRTMQTAREANASTYDLRIDQFNPEGRA